MVGDWWVKDGQGANTPNRKVSHLLAEPLWNIAPWPDKLSEGNYSSKPLLTEECQAIHSAGSETPEAVVTCTLFSFRSVVPPHSVRDYVLARGLEDCGESP
jgi:hypothetical protein